MGKCWGSFHTDYRPAVGFLDFNALGEVLFQLFDMGDDQNLGKILPHQVYGFDQALASLGVLAAKTFIDDQQL